MEAVELTNRRTENGLKLGLRFGWLEGYSSDPAHEFCTRRCEKCFIGITNEGRNYVWKLVLSEFRKGLKRNNLELTDKSTEENAAFKWLQAVYPNMSPLDVLTIMLAEGVGIE